MLLSGDEARLFASFDKHTAPLVARIEALELLMAQKDKKVDRIPQKDKKAA
jgi:hypothetical protein